MFIYGVDIFVIDAFNKLEYDDLKDKETAGSSVYLHANNVRTDEQRDHFLSTPHKDAEDGGWWIRQANAIRLLRISRLQDQNT